MRILVITHVYPRWSGDSQAPFLGSWAKAIVESGHEVLVIAPHDRGALEDEWLDGVHIRRVRYGSEANQTVAYRGQMHELVKHPKGFAQLWCLSKQMRRTIAQAAAAFNPDVVHVHWWVPAMAWVKGLALDAPVVCQVHGTDMMLAERNLVTRRLAVSLLKGCAQIQAVSHDLARRVTQLTGRYRVPVNPMPIHEAFFKNLEPPTHVDLDVATVLGVGRLVKAKGWAELIEACASSPIPLQVRIVGTGPEHDRLVDLAAHLGVTLDLPGTIEPALMPAEYGRADVVVHPSHAEGFGMVIPEALACHRPVVATNSGGVADLLDADDLIPVGDVARLRAAIQAALEDPPIEHLADKADQVTRYVSPLACAYRSVNLWERLVTRYSDSQ